MLNDALFSLLSLGLSKPINVKHEERPKRPLLEFSHKHLKCILVTEDQHILHRHLHTINVLMHWQEKLKCKTLLI